MLKIGDKVRIREFKECEFDTKVEGVYLSKEIGKYAGGTFTVIGIYTTCGGSTVYNLNIDTPWDWSEGMFECKVENKVEKSIVVSGDIVENRNGDRFVALETKEGLMLMGDYFCNINEFNTDLEHKEDSVYDIVAIYETNIFTFEELYSDSLKVKWTREEISEQEKQVLELAGVKYITREKSGNLVGHFTKPESVYNEQNDCRTWCSKGEVWLFAFNHAFKSVKEGMCYKV